MALEMALRRAHSSRKRRSFSSARVPYLPRCKNAKVSETNFDGKGAVVRTVRRRPPAPADDTMSEVYLSRILLIGPG